MSEVEVEWGGKRFRAKVNDYGVALIIGGQLEDFENEGEKAMAMENEKQNAQSEEVMTVVAVGDFVQTILDRQDAFEAEIRKELRVLDGVVKTALANSVATVESLIEQRMRRPPSGAASSN